MLYCLSSGTYTVEVDYFKVRSKSELVSTVEQKAKSGTAQQALAPRNPF